MLPGEPQSACMAVVLLLKQTFHFCRKYKNGAIGSFVHAVALQGTAYSCELEVICDGFQMRLVDPYNAPVLYLRRPGDDIEERHAVSGGGCVVSSQSGQLIREVFSRLSLVVL